MCALVHAIKPSLIAWDSLNRSDELGNLNLAFDAAEKIGVPRLLDAEDMTPGPPEPFSVTTYLGTFYHAAQKYEASGAKEPERPKTTASVTPSRNSASTAVANTPAQSGMSKENVVPVNMGPNCTKCAKPAQGSMIDWNGNLYHQDCFKCAGCNRQFRNTCLNIDGLPYCDTCGRKAFVKSRMIRAGRETGDASPAATTAAAPALPPKDEPSSHARTNSSTSTSSASARTPVPKPSEKPATPAAAPALPAKNDTAASNNGTSASKLATTSSSTASRTSSNSSTVPEKPATTTAVPALPAKNETTSPAYSASTAKSSYTSSSTATKTSTSPSTSVSSSAAPALPPKDATSPTTSNTSSATTGKTTSNIAARADSFAPKPATTTTSTSVAAKPEPVTTTSTTASKTTTNLKPTSSVAGRSTSLAPAWNAPKNQTTTSAAPALPPKQETATSSYASAAKTSSSVSTAKDTPKATSAAPELPKKNETIIEREMREQREKEAELAAAREKARGPSPTPTSTPSTVYTTTTTSTTSATSTTSKPAVSTPTTTNSRGLYKAQTIASSTPTQAASAQPKKESIIEKEMREQREKEEQLARDRERATNVHSKPSSPSPITATSPPTLPERTTSPPPTLPPKNEPVKPEPSKVYSTPKPLRPVSPPPSNLSNQKGSTSPRTAESDAPTLPPRSPRSPSPPVGAPPVPARSSDSPEEYNKPLPPAPSRPQSMAPTFIQSGTAPSLPVRDYAKDPINPSSSTPSSSNATLDLADDVSETENENPEVAEKLKRATRTLRRVNVTRVQEGTKGFLKHRTKNSMFWTRQWFSLQDYRLLFYEKAQAKFALAAEHPPEGFFSLQFVDSITHVAGKKLITLDGGTAYGKVELKASTADEASDWANAINDAMTLFRVSTRDDDLRKSSKPVFGQEHAEDWIMQGTLQRLTPKGSFSSNWWLLQDGMLFYFSQEGGKRLGNIPLFHCEFAPYELDSNKKAAIRAFCITTHTGEKVVLCAKDEMEMHRWLNCMLRQRIVIEEAINTISF